MTAITDNIIWKCYPAYKESGEGWIGQIPEHWEVGKLGNCLKPFSEKGHGDKQLLSITRELGVIERDVENDEGNHNFIPDDLSNYKLIKKGQFGMNKMKAWQGSYGISDFAGIVSPAYYTFNLREEIIPRYFHVAVRSKGYVPFFGRASDGVRIGQWDLSKSRMKEIPFLIPPREEQTAIANFLDEKTAKIDEAIRQKERMIELLGERKQIIIQNAVTKGLDPSVPMKDSGIEWIGEIPAHWEVKKLKFLGGFINGFAFKSSAFTKFGVRVMKISNIQTMEIDWKDDSYLPEKYYSQNREVRVNKNDLVFALTRPVILSGIKSAIVNTDEKILLNQRNAILRPNSKALLTWLYYAMLTSGFVGAFEAEIDNTGQQPNISTKSIGELLIALPPIGCQQEISDKLSETIGKIDRSIEKSFDQIKKLKEYKATLIDSAVTGKINVSSYE